MSQILPQVAHRNALFSGVKKRNNQKGPFQAEKITTAILKAGLATGEFDEPEARRLTIRVLNLA